MSGNFTWTTLAVPVPVPPETAQSVLTALAGISGQPRIVLEAEGTAGRIHWCLGTDRSAISKVLTTLRAHMPELRTDDETRSTHRPSQAVSVHAPGHRVHPLRTDQPEITTRGVLGALAEASKGESVRLQLILGPRYRPRRVHDVDADLRRDVTSKYREVRFGCAIRVMADASNPERTNRLIYGVAAALRALESPGARVAVRRTNKISAHEAKSPFFWPLELSVAELVPMLAWPIASKDDAHLPGLPPRHPKQLPPAPQIARSGLVLGDSATSPDRPVALKVDDALRHVHLLGPTGTGKSTVMGNLALQAIVDGRGAVVIDPKRDLVRDLLERIPADRLDDVVVLDPTDPSPVGLNPLASRAGSTSADLTADTVLGIFHSLYADAWGPRTHDILHASLLTLARRGDAALTMVPLLLTNPGFRRSVTQHAVRQDRMGLGAFWGWFEALSDAERDHAIAPLMNKLRPIMLRPGMRGVLGQRKPKFHLSDVFSRQKILLVPLSKGTLGPEAARLLGSLVIGMLWQTALERGSVPANSRRPVHVFVDEVQEYLRLPGDLGDALAQSRSLGISWVVAHQLLKQLTPDIRESVLTNARSRVAFQLTGKDARDIANGSGSLVAQDFESLPAFEAYAKLLVNGTPTEWCSIRTVPLPPKLRSADDAIRRSRDGYGQPLDEVERDLLALIEPPVKEQQAPLGRRPRATKHKSPGDTL